MEEKGYTLAGWAAIASALLFLPVLGLTLYSDLQQSPALQTGALQPGFLRWAIGLDFLSKIFLLYALLRFRRLLNERYQFHAVDRLIVAVYVAGVSMGVVSYLMRIFPESEIPALVTGLMLMIACGILGIIYATRLLRLSGTLNGLLKPLAYTSLAASVCFVLIVLAPLGLALDVTSTIILGLVFLREYQEEFEELEIV